MAYAMHGLLFDEIESSSVPSAPAHQILNNCIESAKVFLYTQLNLFKSIGVTSVKNKLDCITFVSSTIPKCPHFSDFLYFPHFIFDTFTF